jgi:uncharacterized protein (DUF58 family)
VPVPAPLAFTVWLLLAGAALACLYLEPFVLAWKVVLSSMGLWLTLSALVRPARGAVTVERTVPDRLHVGRPARATLTFTNTGPDVVTVRFRDLLPPEISREGERTGRLTIEGRRQAAVTEELAPCARGKATLGPTGLAVAFPWSLLAFVETLPTETEVRVYPGRPSGEVQKLIARASLLAEVGEHRLRLRGQDQEFDCLSDYVTGDDVRHLDWKASARRMKPQVRRYHIERNAELVLALDTGRLMGTLIGGIRKLDLAITPLLDLAAVGLKRGERVGLIAFSSRVEAYLPPRQGIDRLARFQETLAGLEDTYEQTSYESFAVFLKERHRRRALVILFTDFADELSSRALMSNLAAISRRHLVVFCGVSDPHLETVFLAEAATGPAVFQKAVAADLLTERRSLLVAMRRLGVHVVDGSPAQLSPRVLGAYLEVRLRGLL